MSRGVTYAAVAGVVMTLATGPQPSPAHAAAATTTAGPACLLHGAGGPVSHLVWVQFDNVHLSRDNPNVPSDLEQMPHLLQFMERNGTLLTQQHTPLIAHTADDLVTSMTGLYGDRQGIPISNSYQYYQPDGTTATAGSFAYWGDPVVSYATRSGLGTDHAPTMVGPGGMAPAPWVPFTRAGCDVASVAMANTDLENVLPDIPLAYGRHSTAAAEARTNPSLAATDFQGLAVHCARGSQVCAGTGHQVIERLPNQPGGYDGFHAVFGTKYLDPVIAPAGCQGVSTICNLRGQPIVDGSGNPGFPGYNGMQPWNSLAYTAALQEHGVPVTYTYVSSAHESAPTGNAFGPGQGAYVAQLRAYDDAFAHFFTRLAGDGITPANSLFLFSSDENDHFVGGTPQPVGCNGVTVACTYDRIGEVQGNLTGMLAKAGITTPFSVHADAAPAVYINGQPGPYRPAVRAMERAVARLQALEPYEGHAVPLTRYLADPAELRLLHVWSADPLRNPTFIMFANTDFFLNTGPLTCSPASCVTISPPEAWNHGTVSPQVNRTWLGLVGPGVARLGRTDTVWASHADDNPTVMALLGLRDGYRPQGRVLEEVLNPQARPLALAGSGLDGYVSVAQVFSQLESPVGELGLLSLKMATRAIADAGTGDTEYMHADAALAAIREQRDRLTGSMLDLLDGAAFGGDGISDARARALVNAGERLIGCAALPGDLSTAPCA